MSWSALPEMPGAPTTCSSAALLTEELSVAKADHVAQVQRQVPVTCRALTSDEMFAFSVLRRGA